MSKSSTSGLLVPSEREQLMQAVAELCVERGYGETTSEALIERAAVSERRLAEIFPGGKEECAVAAVQSILAESLAVVSGAYSADISEWDSALLGLRALLELCAARPSLCQLAFIATRQGMPEAGFELYQSGFSLWTAMLDRLRVDQVGELEPPRSAARAAIGGGEAVVRRELSAGRAEALPQMLPDLVYTATIPFLGQEEALRLAARGRELLSGRLG